MTTSDDGYYAEAVAYPTIGIILLGGISDKIHRNPLHTSAGIAYTGLNYVVEARTRVCIGTGTPSGSINGEHVEYSESSRSPFYVLDKYSKVIFKNLGLKPENHSLSFTSSNIGILSGSSDAGAAAIGTNIEVLSGGGVPKFELEADLRAISESAGRSFYGGLSITWVRDGEVTTERVLDESAFNDYGILGCRFNVARNPSDRIHENVVKSPDYKKRIDSTQRKASLLMKKAEDADIEGIFDLAHEDTREYHRLIESVGVHVITPRMGKLMDYIDGLRKQMWVSYIVTGGSNVFIVARKRDLSDIMQSVEGLYDGISLLRVAGSSRPISVKLS